MEPTIGRIVIYRALDGGQSYPAMIAAAGELGLVRALPLSSPTHVHLFVFDATHETPLRERDVPFDEDFGPIAGADESQAPGTWRWPVVVRGGAPGPQVPPKPDGHRPVA